MMFPTIPKDNVVYGLTSELCRAVEKALPVRRFICAGVMCTLVAWKDAYVMYTEMYTTDKYCPIEPQNGFMRRAAVIDILGETFFPLDLSDFGLTEDDVIKTKPWRSFTELRKSLNDDVICFFATNKEIERLDEDVRGEAEKSARIRLYDINEQSLLDVVTVADVFEYISEVETERHHIAGRIMARYGEGNITLHRIKTIACEVRKIENNPAYFSEWEYRLANALPDDRTHYLGVILRKGEVEKRTTLSASDVRRIALNGSLEHLFPLSIQETMANSGFGKDGKFVINLEDIAQISCNNEIIYRKDEHND